MLTKCPKCGKSDQVTGLNKAQRALAATASTIVGVGAKIIFRQTNLTIMKETFKSICPIKKFYCERCKKEFSERTY